MTMLGLALTLLAQGGIANPTPEAPDATYPFVLSYRACTDTGPETQEAIREHCAQVRQALLVRAAPYLDKFFPADRLEAGRCLERSLVHQERYSAWADAHGERLQPSEIGYVTCLTDGVFADADFAAGKHLNGARIARSCETNYTQARLTMGRDSDGRKSKARLWQIKRAFTKLRVVPSLGAGLPGDFSP